MYGWIWRHLPGPWWVRLVLFAAQVLAIVAILFVWGFQHLAPYVPFNDGTVGQ